MGFVRLWRGSYRPLVARLSHEHGEPRDVPERTAGTSPARCWPAGPGRSSSGSGRTGTHGWRGPAASGGEISQAAACQVIAQYLYDTGDYPETDQKLPRRLKDRVSDALGGVRLTRETLDRRGSLDLSPHDSQRVYDIHRGDTEPVTITGTLPPPDFGSGIPQATARHCCSSITSSAGTGSRSIITPSRQSTRSPQTNWPATSTASTPQKPRCESSAVARPARPIPSGTATTP